MGDSPTWNYMKGFYVSRRGKKSEECLNVLQSIGECIENDEIDVEEYEELLPNFIEEFKKLPHWELIWGHGEQSVCPLGDQGGGGIGWHWKGKSDLWGAYDPTEKDLSDLKKLLKKHGFDVGDEIEEGIWAYEG